MKLNLSAGFNMLGRIMACMAFFSGIYISIVWGVEADLSVSIIWEELGVSALTSLPFFFTREKQKNYYSSLLSILGLYIYINAIVLLAGFVFEWYDLRNTTMLIAMLLTILLVFLVVTAITYYVDKQSADEINKQLKIRRNRREKYED